MTNFNKYQIALIAVLVVNLLFWVLVICFRLFFDFMCCLPGQTERIRRRTISRRTRRHFQDSRNSSNRSLVGIGNFEDHDPHHCPYSINGALDAPPTYADAIKHVALTTPERNLPPYPNHFQERTPRRSPFVYEQSVTLVVPEEPIPKPSHSRNEFSATNSECHASDQHAFTRWISNGTNFNNSSIMEESALDSSDVSFANEDIPITFIVDNVGTLSARMFCVKDTTVIISDDKELDSHTQA